TWPEGPPLRRPILLEASRERGAPSAHHPLHRVERIQRGDRRAPEKRSLEQLPTRRGRLHTLALRRHAQAPRLPQPPPAIRVPEAHPSRRGAGHPRGTPAAARRTPPLADRGQRRGFIDTIAREPVELGAQKVARRELLLAGRGDLLPVQ